MAERHDRCPSCGQSGRRVSSTTVDAMLIGGAQATYSGEAMRFCRTASCGVVYFEPSGTLTFGAKDVRVPVFQKSDEPARLVCYCLRHTVRAVQDEADADGRSGIAEDITRRCRAGEDDCEHTNPQGACCLGNVRQVAKQTESSGDDGGGGCCDAPDPGEPDSSLPLSAAPDSGASRRARIGSTIGAMLAALLASACCWLPLVLVGAGASAAGVAGVFESLRPYLLIVTAVMLGVGFFLTYRRRETCRPGGQCDEPVGRGLSRLGIWLATAAALVFVFVPDIIGSAAADRAPSVASSVAEVRTYQISGMTCAGCTAHVRDAIGRIDGVESAQVSYDTGSATVALGRPVDDGEIIRAITSLGYRGHRVEGLRSPGHP